MKARTKAAIFGAILGLGSGYLCLTTALGDGLVLASYDLPFKFRPLVFPKEVVMVYLDDASHEKLHQKYTEVWNRGFYTKLLARLTADHAKAVVFDIIFSDAMDRTTDQAFAKAIETNGNVVIGAELIPNAAGSNGVTGAELQRPAEIFASSAADLGLDGVYPDADMEIRQYLPTTRFGSTSSQTLMASEAWAGAVLAAPSVLTNKTLRDTMFWINYYGPELLALPHVSLYQAVAESNENVPPGFFRNKVVFVGERVQTQLAASRKDEYVSPYSWLPQDRFMSGVGVQATACLNLIRGDYLRRLDWGTERTIILLLGALSGGGLVLFRPIPAFLLAVLSAILIVLVDYLCFVGLHLWLPCLVPILVQIPIALVWSVAAHSVQLYAQLPTIPKAETRTRG